jgi:dihydroxy-acid dehydratase
MSARDPSRLRSARWYAPNSMRASAHRQRTLAMGFRREEFTGRPVIAIVNTWSEMSPCHFHLRERADAVRRGIWQAGGFPVELPALSLGEVMVKPTTMLYRNLLALETEELLRQHPIDGAVLIGGCDKTTPGLLMGAFTMDLPSIYVPAGFMMSGNWRGTRLGVGTHTMKYWNELRAGTIEQRDWDEVEANIARSPGTCQVMGTASTMTAIAETLGFSLPGASSLPAMDANHVRMCSEAGSRIVDMVWDDLKPSSFLTKASFVNAMVVHASMAGSTNAVIHLLALARRAGVPLTIDEFDPVAQNVPALTDVLPSGKYLMEDFYFAGGLPALMQRLGEKLDLAAMTVTGRPLADNIANAKVNIDDVIRPLSNPISSEPGLAVLRGNLAPNGCVMKPSAADKRLLMHEGKALVFENIRDLNARIDDPDLAVDENTVLVLKMGGPEGAPGMPEWGGLPIPKKLLARGVRDMVRISDARMSGTHYGACVLHVSPEAATGGPLALVQTGDTIRLDVAARRIDLVLPEDELAKRRAAWMPPPQPPQSGYVELFRGRVLQAHEGCDFVGFGRRGIPEPEIF